MLIFIAIFAAIIIICVKIDNSHSPTYKENKEIFRISKLPLRQRFQEAQKKNNGCISGMSFNEMVKYTGYPNSYSKLFDGTTLRQWMETTCFSSYHVCLIFDKDDICLGVSSETSI